MEVDWSHITKKRKNVTKQALDWNPQGQRRRGRPKNTWRRGLNTELQKIRMTWNETKTRALKIEEAGRQM